jgi:hypothetical protein
MGFQDLTLVKPKQFDNHKTERKFVASLGCWGGVACLLFADLLISL